MARGRQMAPNKIGCFTQRESYDCTQQNWLVTDYAPQLKLHTVRLRQEGILCGREGKRPRHRLFAAIYRDGAAS